MSGKKSTTLGKAELQTRSPCQKKKNDQGLNCGWISSDGNPESPQGGKEALEIGVKEGELFQQVGMGCEYKMFM